MNSYQSVDVHKGGSVPLSVQILKVVWLPFVLAYIEFVLFLTDGFLIDGGVLTQTMAMGVAITPLMTGFGFALWSGITFIPNLLLVTFVKDRLERSDAERDFE